MMGEKMMGDGEEDDDDTIEEWDHEDRTETVDSAARRRSQTKTAITIECLHWTSPRQSIEVPVPAEEMLLLRMEKMEEAKVQSWCCFHCLSASRPACSVAPVMMAAVETHVPSSTK